MALRVETEVKICSFCKRPVQGHPECDACGILCCGNDYYDPLSEFRGYRVCRKCKEHWLYLERYFGRQVSFGRFKGKERVEK